MTSIKDIKSEFPKKEWAIVDAAYQDLFIYIRAMENCNVSNDSMFRKDALARIRRMKQILDNARLRDPEFKEIERPE